MEDPPPATAAPLAAPDTVSVSDGVPDGVSGGVSGGLRVDLDLHPAALSRLGLAAGAATLNAALTAAVAAALGAAVQRVPAFAHFLDHPLEVSLVLAEDGLLRDLNRTHRGKEAATDVLSFPAGLIGGPLAPQMADGAMPLPLGDVVIAAGVVATDAAALGRTPLHHLCHMVVHGVLHLGGFDHETEVDAAVMEALEAAALAQLGYPHPYDGQGESNE